MTQLSFNPAAVDTTSNSRELLPQGRYTVVCEKSEVKPNKKNNGHYLSLAFVVQDEAYKKRRLFENMNIQHENPTAEKIGQQRLAALCKATGIAHLENTFQLHGIPVEVEVGVEEAKGEWPAKNVIKGYIKRAEVAGGIDLTKTKPMMPTPPAMPTPTPASFSNSGKSLSDLDDDIPF